MASIVTFNLTILLLPMSYDNTWEIKRDLKKNLKLIKLILHKYNRSVWKSSKSLLIYIKVPTYLTF